MTTVSQLIKRIFLNEKFIMAVILLNACVIYAQTDGCENMVLTVLDIACTLIFLIEMIVKHVEYGVRGYWRNGWNRLDGILVIAAIPSLIELWVPLTNINLSVLLILRVLRVLRFFRVIHFFPNFAKIVKAMQAAMRDSYGVLLSFFVTIVIFGLLNCSLFRNADPAHFSTPLRSIYSVFQICTVEGWYEIPNAVADYYSDSTVLPHLIRCYFVVLLILGGIIGMSFINSIFVDAMVADNNDTVEAKIDELNAKIDKLQSQIEQLTANKLHESNGDQ